VCCPRVFLRLTQLQFRNQTTLKVSVKKSGKKGEDGVEGEDAT